MTNTPQGIEVLPDNTRTQKALEGPGLAPLGPEWILPTPYGFEYGITEHDGKPYLATRETGSGEWKTLLPARAGVLYAFRRFQERPHEPELAEFVLTGFVLEAVREKGLGS